MRIRSTKPEFYRSKTIAELSWSDRHVLKALESYVDDNGVGKDDVELFAADAFPRDMFRNAPETFGSLSTALDAFEKLGLIVRYEANGDRLLYVDRWSERQRIDKPSKGRFPRPDGTFQFTDEVDRSSYATTSGGLQKVSEIFAPGTEEQRNRGTGEQTSSSDVADATPDQERPEVQELCELLAHLVEENGSKPPKVTKTWLDECRRLIDIDGRSHNQIRNMIQWSQRDTFWRANVRSMPTLRKQYDAMRLRAMEQGPTSATRPTASDDFDPMAQPPVDATEDEVRAWYAEQERKAFGGGQK